METEEQTMLREAAKQILDVEAGGPRFRALRDAGQTTDPALWSKLVELGFAGVTLPESAGGLGMGLGELAVIMEELGRSLGAVPLLSAVSGGSLWADGVAAGRVVGLAWRESGRGFDPSCCAARVIAGRITGRKLHVIDGAGADAFVVSAIQDGELGLFAVDGAAARREPLNRVDQRDAAHVVFQDADCVQLPGGIAELRTALDAATVALAAEMLGGAAAALEMTLAYLRERVQFDRPIGSFQALQHRAVDCYVALELARVAVAAAATEPTPSHVSLAKARCNDVYMHVAKEAVQLFGGIGMTDEHDVGFHLKRAMVTSRTLGDSAWHRDRWGRERGY